MIIQEPDPKTRVVHDFEFTFVNGHAMSFTIDKEAGDEITIDGPMDTMIIYVTAKPSPDGTFMYPAETATLTKAHIVSIKRTERVIQDLTQAQKDLFKLTTQEMFTRTIQ